MIHTCLQSTRGWQQSQINISCEKQELTTVLDGFANITCDYTAYEHFCNNSHVRCSTTKHTNEIKGIWGSVSHYSLNSVTPGLARPHQSALPLYIFEYGGQQHMNVHFNKAKVRRGGWLSRARLLWLICAKSSPFICSELACTAGMSNSRDTETASAHGNSSCDIRGQMNYHFLTKVTMILHKKKIKKN